MGLGVLGLRPRASRRQTGWCALHDGQRAGLVPAGGLGQLRCRGRVGRSDLRIPGRKSRRHESGAGEERDTWAARAAALPGGRPALLAVRWSHAGLMEESGGPRGPSRHDRLFTAQPAPKGHHTIVPSHQEPELPLPSPLLFPPISPHPFLLSVH